MIEWLAPPRSEPRVVLRREVEAVSVEVAAHQAALELVAIRAIDDMTAGFRILRDGEAVLTKWLRTDPVLSVLPSRAPAPKARQQTSDDPREPDDGDRLAA